jgi:hypothetical protein
MKVFYVPKLKEWFHTTHESLTFGGLRQPIPSYPNLQMNQVQTFQLQLKDHHIGPLVGIMTAPKTKNKLAGNRQLFTTIQTELLDRNSLSYIFSYLDISLNGTIDGYIFIPWMNKWMKARMPLPDIVYNRIPYRQDEKTEHFNDCLRLFKQYHIPLFNPNFIDKYELYLLLNKTSFSTFLPETLLIQSKNTLEHFLIENKMIYIKPRLLLKGINTFRLHKDDKFIIENHHTRNVYDSFDELWTVYGELFNNGTFIAQKAIHPHVMDGRRYDFRILSHWSEKNQQYNVTGIGIRATNKEQLTTHLAYGGTIIPYSEVQKREHDDFIEYAVQGIGLLLSKQMGFFGEFSIDAGIDINGNYYIYEVNSKPMSFDEEHIEKNRVIQLCHLFEQKTGFKD